MQILNKKLLIVKDKITCHILTEIKVCIIVQVRLIPQNETLWDICC